MKRRMIHILSLLLTVGLVFVTTPCGCKAASDALRMLSPQKHEICSCCAKREQAKHQVNQGQMDRQTVQVNHAAPPPVAWGPSAHLGLVAGWTPSTVTLAVQTQVSPPSSPPLNLRI